MTSDPLSQAQEVLDTYAEDLQALEALNFIRACYDDPPLAVDDVVFTEGPYPGTRAVHLKNCDCGNHPKPQPKVIPTPQKLTKRFIMRELWEEIKDMFRR